MKEFPTFGIQEENVRYKKRVGAYIVVVNAEETHILLVQAPNHAYFLPGGEIEANETKEEAIHREVMEELGFEVVIGKDLGRADEYFLSTNRGTYYFNPGYFFVAQSWKKVCPPLEKTNNLKWFPIDEGIRQLKRGSHQWAVKQWKLG